ncbi:MAG TPA: flagellar hook-basal body complex protein [Sphingobium sp.]|uniref:flagellar hook-basal body complex protein n=1 Tax=Sphingobium sp. TaxID=1912891 RepID=UPI002ED0E6B4
MDTQSFVLLSHEQALRRRMDVAANNIANSSTVGFKSEQPVFHEYVERVREAPVEDARKTSFVLDFGAVHDTAQGAFQATGNPLDVMIDGPGYLTVQAGDGSTAYTRAGFIKILANGDLATSSGHKLLGDNDRPINIPEDQRGRIAITTDGTVMGAAGALGRIAVTAFADETSVSQGGDGMMTGQGGRRLLPKETQLKTGGVEGSNVQTIVETTRMIDILRSYQTSARISQDMDSMRSQAINSLGRVN